MEIDPVTPLTPLTGGSWQILFFFYADLDISFNS